ncbi:MAG: Tad domain-containing protein [Bacteriovorax sp.]|nr:Tad domain-containing protein [Bacteriovorax sp.]
MIKSNRGQLSIFMGITLIIVMSMLAFIINVGLFVKAKINLQNATDAAAFSGAATQARQLTNIAYANWELRNTYKEWMFKYYVLGQLGLVPYNLKDNNIAGKQTVNFLLPTPDISGVTDFDKYNIPSICIHNNSKTNICPIYALPGIPRFPAIGVAGISEIHEAFVNKLVEEKGKDCSRRSKANFLTALTWAYGAGGGISMPDAPLVATNRPGAWPEALELSFRIRNLEMIVNRPPVADISLKNIGQFQGQAVEIGLNERPIKAFWSAYRNLGGGAYKNNNVGSGAIDELSYNLSLTELAPQSFHADGYPLSRFLIPPDFHYSNGTSALEKRYLDLQLMPVNLATMFSTFVDTANAGSAAMGGVAMEATCGISKSALPVPGYIMGFNKNPEVLTYYAVKAESKFIGLFFPIGTSSGIKLTAYAAAKPFGGRIGPKLFAYTGGDQATVEAREDANRRSRSYINGLKIEVIAAGGFKFKPGMPIPSSSSFWVNDSNPVIGGVPGTGKPVFFGIPNMIYDFADESDLVTQKAGSGKVQVIDSAFASKNNVPTLIAGVFTNAIVPPKETLGLYHAPQLKALRASIGMLNPGTSMSGDDVLKSIIRARRPTRYDAINYLVPDFREVSDQNNAAPIVQRLNAISGVGFTYKLFAPLIGPNLLYTTPDAVKSVINTYIDTNGPAVDTYLKSLLVVANSIFNLATQGDNKEAARSIHANAGSNTSTPDPLPAAPASDPGCKSDLASKFNHFFTAEYTGCDIVPLKKMMIEFLNRASSNEGGLDKSMFYIGYYFNEPGSDLNLKPETLMTAYFPGARQGTSGEKGIAEHPLKLTSPGSDSYSTRRNFYSTKFFQMAKVLDTAPGGGAGTGIAVYQEQPALRESDKAFPDDLVGKIQLRNPLKYSEVGNNSYFLDF